MKETETREGNLWGLVLNLAIECDSEGIEELKVTYKDIGERMGGGIHDKQDMEALVRIVWKANNGNI